MAGPSSIQPCGPASPGRRRHLRSPAMTDTLEAVKTYQQFIGGGWADSASGETLDVINPADDQVIAKVPKSAAEDVDRAVEAAANAFPAWGAATPAGAPDRLPQLAPPV